MPDNRDVIVLLVEDETLVRMFADEVLTEDGGFKVIVTSNADEALTVLRVRQDVRVLFTDITMPGSIDGLQLAHLVREQWPSVAVVVTSARAPRKALPTGARFLMKPYRPLVLVDTIRDLLVEASVAPPEGNDSAAPNSAAPVLPRPVNLDGLSMGLGTTGGLAQPLPDRED
jgi:DNA-binding NarL/FixJ family response regulator